MRIAQSVIQQIEERLDAVDVVGAYVPLERRGDKWWGCCPFHIEKTPSFTVSPERRSYYCFGCQKSGSLFSFYGEMEGLSFVETVKALAQKVGVDLEIDSASVQQEQLHRRSLLELYEKISFSFEHLLWHSRRGNEALKYIFQRGLSEETLRSYRVGYVMGGYEELHQFLLKRGYSEDYLATTGLFAVKNPRYSLFRDRLVFPITDSSGAVVAFSGRAMPDAGSGTPKYINSPDTPIFRKREILFGLKQAKEGFKEHKKFILCEGAVDVCAVHQMGYGYAVAPLGSAFSIEQAQLLKRWCKQGVLLMDGDEAGQKASLRAAILCEQHEIESRAAKMHEGKDPAELLQRGRVDLLTKSLNNANFSFDFLTNNAIETEPAGDPAGIKRICLTVFSYISAVLSPVRREAYLNLLAGRLSLSPSAIGQEFELFMQQNKGRAPVVADEPEFRDQGNEPRMLPTRVISPDYDAVYELYCAFLLHGDLYAQWKNQLAFLDLSALGLSEVESYLQANDDQDDIMTFLQHGLTDSSVRAIFLDKIATAVHFDNDWQARVQMAVRRLRIRALEQSRIEAIEELAAAEEQAVGIDIISDLQREVLLIDAELIEMKADSNE